MSSAELDAKVAEAMGWTDIDLLIPASRSPNNHPLHCGWPPDSHASGAKSSIPQASRDLNAAFEFVEWLKQEKGIWIVISGPESFTDEGLGPSSGEWRVVAGKTPYEFGLSGAQSPAVAICQAGLSALADVSED